MGPAGPYDPMPLPKKSGEIATFLEKLYEMLEDPEYEDYISWCKSGETILIKKEEDFSKIVLPKFYKHNNFHSFVRQLNMYSFSKTRHDAHWLEFRQPNFQRGKRDLLAKIRRKGSSGSGSGVSESRKAAVAFEQVDKYQNELETLRQELLQLNARLQGAENNLWVVNERFTALRQENVSLWKFFCEAAVQDPTNPVFQGIRIALSTAVQDQEEQHHEPHAEAPQPHEQQPPMQPQPASTHHHHQQQHQQLSPMQHLASPVVQGGAMQLPPLPHASTSNMLGASMDGEVHQMHHHLGHTTEHHGV